MGGKLGYTDVLGLCLVLVKLLSWLLVVLCVCGVMIIYLLMLIGRFIVWLLRQIKDASDKGKLHPSEDHIDMQSTVNIDHNAASDVDDDDIDDDELYYNASEYTDDGTANCHGNSNGSQEQRMAAGVREELEYSVECSEAGGTQDLVVTVDKIPEDLKRQFQQERLVNIRDDDSDLEDEEYSKGIILDCYEDEEEFVFSGAVPNQSSDTKSDDEDKMIVTVGGIDAVIEDDGSFAPHVEPAEDDDEEYTTAEVNELTSTMLLNPATCEHPAYLIGQMHTATQQDHDHNQCGEIFPDCTTPND